MLILSFLGFTGLVAFLTWLITRKDDLGSSDGFFLGGRSLTFPLIAGSLLLTNLSTEQMVGLNGQAFTDGLSVMAWEVVAVLALAAMAVFFLPRFLRSGVTTVPEFLHRRFDHGTQVICNLIFLSAYAIILLPIILYTGATGLAGMLNIPALTGIESPTTVLWLTVWLVGIVGSIYALFAGEGLHADHAYGRLVNHVLPKPLTGFFAAVMVGAILSSFNSALNSTTTLFSLGLYKAVLRKDATEKEIVKSGKVFG